MITMRKEKAGAQTRAEGSCDCPHGLKDQTTWNPGGRYMATHDGPLYRRFAAAMIISALEDLQDPKPAYESGDPEWRRVNFRDWKRARLNAICWLASRDATVWFECSGYDQRVALLKAGWPAEARKILTEVAEGELGEVDPRIMNWLRKVLRGLERTD